MLHWLRLVIVIKDNAYEYCSVLAVARIPAGGTRRLPAMPAPTHRHDSPATKHRLVHAAALLLVAATFATGSASPTVQSETFHWSASPTMGPAGQILPPAVAYEVWVAVEAAPATLAAIVADTAWTLQAETGCAYALRVRGVAAAGQHSAFSPWSASYRFGSAAGVPATGMPDLGPARPNPFNARTAITYTVPDVQGVSTPVGLAVYDLRGRLVRSFPTSPEPGAHTATWDGTDAGGRTMPAGIYLARYDCGARRAILKLSLVK